MIKLTILLTGAAALSAPLPAQTTATQSTPAGVAQTPPASTAPAATAPASTGGGVATGAQVTDTSGAPVGTIEAVSAGVATLSTGTNKVQVPVSSFAQGANGPVIAMTKAQIDAQASAATKAANAPVEITVGAAVSGPQGAKVGTVTEVAGNMVTVKGTGASAKLPKSSFAKGPNGLVIGITPAEFDAAAKAAGGGAAATPGS